MVDFDPVSWDKMTIAPYMGLDMDDDAHELMLHKGYYELFQVMISNKPDTIVYSKEALVNTTFKKDGL